MAERPAPTEAHPRSGVRRWLWIGALVFTVVLAVWVVAFSSLLGVSTVQVTGTRLLSPGQIRASAAIRPGTPLVRLDTAAIERRVAKLPVVRSVRVSTSYPSTVTIAITERVGVGYRMLAGATVEVDVDDVAFRTLSSTPKALPVLISSGSDALDSEIAQVSGALNGPVRSSVARISALSAEAVTLVLRDGRTVLWGGMDGNADKARLLPALLGRPGSYFDISDPSSVISR
ncbi:FtsQ-type POTRA domain-containing protein [Jatrophihabitans telluris]|uniref:FtsQ-type POTRA domain-containing protein n=1 Tax=Jatrophihabitans telluris TaxID=2038343 RepID=A0ABY4QVX3_9ACTN|nr:FtsQ-type POTRA domain-containing protein [Jatrophihabitans telluris]UQX87186.1 FtsQ-type POTRA domain-containing protein [Jatrophihabitans telluris]